MKVKVSEATDSVLDWLVVLALGDAPDLTTWWFDHKNYSTDWSEGGPIIEREKISVKAQQPEWAAYIAVCDGLTDRILYGPTSLIAAMRCFVASKLGDEVDVPEELI